MKVALDTNVVVSGLLRPFGSPAEIVRMMSSGVLTVCYDARILVEYREVLLRPKFRLEVIYIDALLDQIKAEGSLVVTKPLAAPLPDMDDEMFLEVAIAGNVRCLVTGNLKHYPPSKRQGISVVSPREFLEICRREI